MTFLDINTFHGPRAGGIRTYHNAKIAFFSGQSEHLYCLVYPGPCHRVDRPSPSVILVQVPGIRLTSDPEGYRLILNYFPVARWIRKLRPDVIEAGDAWLTSWFCLMMRASGLWRGLLVSFFHSNPVPTYFAPWAARGGPARKAAVLVLGRAFYAIQRRFDWTAVSSPVTLPDLHRGGVTRTCCLPFGADAAFFAPPPSSVPLRRQGDARAPARFLYAGRLDRDKGIELLLEILPRLLEAPDVEVTVAGRGAFAARFEEIRHPRFRFEGFVAETAAMAALYASHDVMLAPGPHETFGMAVLEAMASGMAVVGPRAGGTGDMLAKAGAGFTFAPGDADGFLEAARAAAVADLASESERMRESARAGGTWNEAIARMAAHWTECARGAEGLPCEA